jgi:hypothetical protein
MASTVEILQSFSGFPNGVEKPEVHYLSGAIVEVDPDFAKMIVAKGLARLLPAKPTPSKPEEKNEAQ